MGNAAQNKAFDLSSFLGSMFGDGQNVPEARNDFGVGDVNEILDTQLKTQKLAGQAAGNQAYNNLSAATALGERTARNKQARNQQDLLFANELAKSNSTTRSGGTFSRQVPLLEDVGFQRSTMEFNRNVQAARNIARQSAAIAANQKQRDIANQKALNTQQNMQARMMQGSQLASNKEIARIDAQGRLAAAQLGMQGQVLGSLFGSINSGTPNYRYWGG